MADRTGIEWTDATWNPLSGCSLVSPGCTNCYAMGVAHRFRDVTPLYAGLTHEVNGKPVWTGKIAVNEKVLDQPLRWKAPRRIFVNSMSDLFHEAVPDAVIDRLLMVMGAARQHTFQILTKRADRMQAFMVSRNDILPNVWLGVSVEDQRRADERIPLLLATPAALRFVSAEPLLGPVDLERVKFYEYSEGKHHYVDVLRGGYWSAQILGPAAQDGEVKRYFTNHSDLRASGLIDWVIVGGESGPSARPVHPDWVRALRDQCENVDVPFFFKQWGEWSADALLCTDIEGRCPPPRMKIGKKASGYLLDGETWQQMPQVPA